MNEMTCTECAGWLNAYLDNELDTEASVRVRSHLEGCADCKARYEELAALRQGLRTGLPFHEAPEGLRQNLLSRLPRTSPAASAPRISREWRRWRMPAFSTAALAAAVLLYVFTPVREDRLEDEVVSSHVRSLMVGHLMDVVSSDQHTVKPWFAGKLDFSPPVYDFTLQGYSLLGGRLDYVGHQTVAALSYRHAKHIINVFVMPTNQSDAAPKHFSVRGFNLIAWRQNHLSFEAVSDLNAEELQALAVLFINQAH